MQCPLGLGCFLSAAVANQSTALGQAKVEGQQGAMLHADSPQCGAIDLLGKDNKRVGKGQFFVTYGTFIFKTFT